MTPPISGYKHLSYPDGNVTQFFGVNQALYSKVVCYPDNSLPEKKYCLHGHNGIDIVAPWGTLLLAVKDAVVSEVKDDAGGYGKHIRIIRDCGDGRAEEWTYGHCSEILVKLGQQVKAGNVIAKMGNTGFVVSGATPFWKYNPYAGTHLHLGVRYYKIWDGTGQYNLQMGGLKLTSVLNYYNGFYGAVDFGQELALATGAVDTPAISTLRLTLSSLYNQLEKLIKNSRKVG